LAPHPISNDLTDQSEIISPEAPSNSSIEAVQNATEATTETPALTPTERRVGRWLLGTLAAVIVAAVLVAAILVRNWTFVWIAAMVFIPYMMYLLAPIWLAESTRIAQDEHVREG
jgi:hypothetical protein